MKGRILAMAILFTTMALITKGQENFPVNGVPDEFNETYLLKNATIHPGNDISTFVGDILIRDGKIVKALPNLEDAAAIIIDLDGKHIYPSFIDMYAQYGIEDLPKKKGYPEQFLSDKPGAYSWNEALKSEFRAHEGFIVDEKESANWRDAGFGLVLSHRMDGISRGSGCLVWVADLKEHEMILKPMASNQLSLKRGSSMQDYPSSQMGSIALLRQTYYDGQWYAKQHRDINISLEAWNELQDLPTIIDASGHLAVFRVDKIGDEFGKQFIIKGTGKEYRRLDAVKATGATIIIPINYPDAIDVEDPWKAEYVTLEDMKHWELAPYNLKMVNEDGITFAITSHDLKERSSFLPNMIKAVEKGLQHDDAMKALTEMPARLLGIFDEVGSVEAGKWANLLVTNQPVFTAGATIYQNWIKGIPYQVNDFPPASQDGQYMLIVGDSEYIIQVSNSKDTGRISLQLNDTTTVNGEFKLDENEQVNISYAIPEGFEFSGYTTLTGWKNNTGFEGRGKLPDGEWIVWKADRIDDVDDIDEDITQEEIEADAIGSIIYPFLAYGWESKPVANKTLFRNATVWTNEEDGVLENSDVLIEDGKIIKVGKDLNPRGSDVIDASGMHLTSGIIDEHSHIGISAGVNEGSQSSSAEVSIADVVNSEDVNLYRQLAGGVTAAQLLHGSANPIGGQSALVKFRWGSLPEEMKIEGADGFIKFALGENVKRSNWSTGVKRFPQTRMGVEQVFIDHFTRAKEYNAITGEKRYDIELEVLAEILNKERFITCHSYVQSEITMLMRVAEKFNFNINTFTHILEGYKVADKMKDHGVGGSSFSDWWAYKFEVIDAIPYNAALMNEMGVVVAINSDDAEMGRRLNQEAAKAVKYGGASEEDAWKMVTLNPAKLLHLDDHMGSIKAGKDADLVLWSDHPLSIYAVVQQTYVDGVKYYDSNEDVERRKSVEAERARLIQLMLEAKKGGAEVVEPTVEDEHYYHCDDLEDWAGNDHEH